MKWEHLTADQLSAIHARPLARQVKLIQEDEKVMETCRRFLKTGHFEG